MNTEIIPITLREDGIRTVTARSLHTELGVGKDFSTWIKDRIEQYGFEEGSDYQLDSPESGNQDSRSHGGDRRSKEYHITLDMAKELAMVERTPQGKFWRQYFIRMEKLYVESSRALPEPQEPAPATVFLDLPPAVQLHREQFAYLLSQGVPPATACRSADQFIKNYKPPVAEADQEPTARDHDRQRLLDMMQRDVWYSTEDLAALLPPRHHLRGGSKEARGSRIGKLLKDALDQLRLEKHPNSRHALYRLPAVVEFPEASGAES